MEIIEGKPVFYSMGNFVFDQNWSVETSEGLVIESTFSNLKRQMRLEQHLAKTPAGLVQRIVQRLLASVFLALKPGGVFFLGFEGRELTAILAWLRQAGFEAIHQGSSGASSGVLARRIGPAAAGR